jgi:hypothetical protein
MSNEQWGWRVGFATGCEGAAVIANPKGEAIQREVALHGLLTFVALLAMMGGYAHNDRDEFHWILKRNNRVSLNTPRLFMHNRR